MKIFTFCLLLVANLSQAQPVVLSQLSQGQTLKTSSGESQSIQLQNDSELTLSENTKIKVIDSGSPAEFELLSGALRGKISKAVTNRKNKLFIKTKSATMGVRGTEFIVEQNGGEDAQFYTLEGEIDVASTKREILSGKATRLKKGFQMRGAKKLSAPKRFQRKQLLNRFQKKHPGLFKSRMKSKLRNRGGDAQNLRKRFEDGQRPKRDRARPNLRNAINKEQKRPRIDRQQLRQQRHNKFPPPPPGP